MEISGVYCGVLGYNVVAVLVVIVILSPFTISPLLHHYNHCYMCFLLSNAVLWWGEGD